MKFLLEISATLSHIATMEPNGGVDDESMPHFFKLRCQNCQELSKRQCVYISESVQHGRDTVNHVIKCKECKKYGTVMLIPGYGRPFTAENSESGAYAPLMLFDCDGMAPEEYEFNGGWKLTTDLGVEIEEVNLVNEYKGERDMYGNKPKVEKAEGRFTIHQA